MSWRLVSVLLALSVLLNAFFIAGFVFRGWIAPLPFEREMRRPPPPGPRPSALDMVADEVDLDAAQREALRSVFDRYASSRRERYKETQAVREQLVAEHKRIPLDPARIDPLIDQLAKLRADQHKETVRALAEIEARLNPEQRDRLHHVLADRLSGPPRRPPPPRGGPGRGPPRPTQ